MRHTARQTRANRTITVDFQNEATYLGYVRSTCVFSRKASMSIN